MNRTKKGKKGQKPSELNRLVNSVSHLLRPQQPAARRRQLERAHVYAPAGVSSSLRNHVTFSTGSTAGSLKMTYRLPLCQIGNGGTAASNAGLLNSGGGYVPSLGLHADCVDIANVVSLYWQSPGLNLISECFSRYKTSGSARFTYCPQSTSNSTDRLVFGFSSDPDHPLLYAGGGSTTQANLLGLSESVPFAPWNEWSLDVHLDTIQKYVASTSSSNLDTTERRLTAMGIFGCVGTGVVTTTPTVYGVLYLEGSIEFLDMNPLVVLSGTPAYLKRQVKLRAQNGLAESKSQESSEKIQPSGWFSVGPTPRS